MPTGEGKVAVVIPAAGTGSRMGGRRKQFRLLGDAPLLVQTLRAFDRHPEVECAVLALPEDEREAVEALLAEAALEIKVVTATGGATRQDSVGAALGALPEGVGWVLVHDGVRPFVSLKEISAVIAAAKQHGTAAVAIPVADTLRRAGDGVFGETIPREGLYRMLTPQGFRRDLLESAHAAAHGRQETDDVALVAGLGVRVHVVEGSALNIKVTTKADWDLAQMLWGAWSPSEEGAE